jgi:hypothetical protein
MTYDEGGRVEAAITDHPEYWTDWTNWENYVVIQKVALVGTKCQMSCYGGAFDSCASTSMQTKFIRFVGSRMIGTEPGGTGSHPEAYPAFWSEYSAKGTARPAGEEHYYTQSFRRGDNPQTILKEGPPPHMPVDITLLGWKSIRYD